MKRIVVDPADLAASLEEAVAALTAGGVVLFPAERLYGLAADATDSAAVAEVFAIKGRDPSVPLPVIVGGAEEAAKWVELPDWSRPLIERCWPGPLTLVAPAKRGLAPEAMGGRDTIGIRVPGNDLARELARSFGGPLTATSANPSGAESVSDLGRCDPRVLERAALTLDAGVLPGPPGSTVLQLEKDRAVILRAGALDKKTIKEMIKDVELI